MADYLLDTYGVPKNATEEEKDALFTLTADIQDKKVYDALDTFEDYILYKAFIEPQRQKNIIVVFVEAKSGQGKSMTTLGLAERIDNLVNRIEGRDIPFDVDKQVVYTPGQYNKKIKWWESAPQTTMIMEEMRQFVDSRDWHSLMTRAIEEGNALLRAIKYNNTRYGGVLLLNSQDLGDMTKRVRKTINIDILVKRYGDSHVVIRPYEFWMDRSNVESPVMRPKKFGVKEGNFEFVIKHAFISLPSTPVRKRFDKLSVDYKSRALEKKREQLLRALTRKTGEMKDLKEEISQDEMFIMVKNMASFNKRGVFFSKNNKRILMRMFHIPTEKDFRKEFIDVFVEECKRRNLLDEEYGKKEDDKK